MSDEINVISRTQTIIVDPSSGSVSVINAGPAGPGGPPGEMGAELESVDSLWGEVITQGNGGVANMNRRIGIISAIAILSGTVYFTVFKSPKSFTPASIKMGNGTAATAVTLAKMGLYSINPLSLEMTLIASTANDTTIFNTANVANQRNFVAAPSLLSGSWYATALIVVGTGTMPAIMGPPASAYTSIFTQVAPRLCGSRSGQTDFPATITAGQIAPSGLQGYAELLAA